MNEHPEIDGAKTSSQSARTRAVEPRPSHLDAEHAAAPAGPLDVTQRPRADNGHGHAGAWQGTGSKADTATGEGLRSAGQALAPPLGY